MSSTKKETTFNYIWPQDWNTSPKCIPLDADFSRHLRVRKPILFSLTQPDNKPLPSSKVPPRLIRSLRKSPLQTLSIHPCHDQCTQLKLRSLKSLKLEGDSKSHQSRPLCAKKLLLACKNLKSLYISSALVSPTTRKYLSSLKKLVSIHIVGLSNLSELQLRQTFLNRPSPIKHLTLDMSTYFRHGAQAQALTRLLQNMTELPRLKSLRFIADNYPQFDIDNIFFDVLRQKNIAYDVRVGQSNSAPALSNSNVLGFKNTEFLGITSSSSLYNKTEWPIAREDHLKLQKEAKSLLFLRVPNPERLLSKPHNIFHICSNIQTLDLVLTTSLLASIDFSPLKDLQNLKNIFIRIENVQGGLQIPKKNSTGLFEALSLYQQTCKNIQVVSISVARTSLLERDYKSMVLFMEACSPSVQKITLNLYNLLGSGAELHYFYDSLAQLKQVKSMSIVIREEQSKLPGYRSYLASHYTSLWELLQAKKSLEGLLLIIPNANRSGVELTLKGIKGLKALKVMARNTKEVSVSKKEILGLVSLREAQQNSDKYALRVTM